ncbi:MAG: redoxin domain-containing protein [Opitutaceae bacterium]|nr:redoxin domain-containing protein [Cytophagales bacterium]
MKHSIKYLLPTLLIFALEANGQTPIKHLTTGDSLPYFAIPDQDGKIFNSKDQKGKGILIVFFYPKDNANISTKQVLGFKEHFKEFEE